MASSTVDFAVFGDPERARLTLVEALQRSQFRITWQTPEYGIAERGSRGAYIAVGAFAQYFKLTLQVTPVEGGSTMLRVSRVTNGALGGIPGIIRTRRQFAALATELASTFTAAGVLVKTP